MRTSQISTIYSSRLHLEPIRQQNVFGISFYLRALEGFRIAESNLFYCGTPRSFMFKVLRTPYKSRMTGIADLAGA